MITLRDYQADGILKIRESFASQHRAPLYVLPCGGGKTVIFSAIAESSQRRSKRVLILNHRVELIDQVVAALKQFDVEPDVIAAGYGRLAGRRLMRANHPVSVASVQTLVRRLDQYPEPDLVIIDECHHANASTWSQILSRYRHAKVLGVTASPIRLDGHGLGKHFDHMIVGPSVAELTAQGYLSPTRIFAPPTVDTSKLRVRAGEFKIEEAEALLDVPSITGDALSHYKHHAPGKPALVFCTSVAHAHHVAEQFRKDGIGAVALEAGTDKDLRRMAVTDFRDGRLQVITQCDLANEGWDLPGVHCGIFLRPTQSLGLYIQQTGRCSRIAPGKTHAILLDHVGNVHRFGMPDEPRDWQLTPDIIAKKQTQNRPAHICPKCWAASPFRASACIECGYVFEPKERKEVKHKEGTLKELTPEQAAAHRALMRERQLQGRSKSLQQLIQFGRRKGYADGWAEHVWRNRKRKSR